MYAALQPLDSALIYYPDSDGEPMAESDFQRDYLSFLVEALRTHFQDQPQVYVSGNLLIYYEIGKPRVCISPDVFVVFGVSSQKRRIYQTWVEGKGPDWVMEITSNSTRRQDEILKPALYQRLGVKEYFQYDPTGDYLKPALRARSLNPSPIRELPAWPQAKGGLIIHSELLGLQFRLEGGQLRVFDPDQQCYLFNYSEAVTAYHRVEQQVFQAERLAYQEQLRAEQAEQRVAEERLRAEKLAAQLRALGIDPDHFK